MKRAFIIPIAVACLSVPASAAPMCGLSLPMVEKVAAGQNGPQRLNDTVAMAFLDKFNNSEPVTNYQAPVWVIDRPKEGVIEVIATSEGRGCVFIAPGHLREVVLKMLYGEAS